MHEKTASSSSRHHPNMPVCYSYINIYNRRQAVKPDSKYITGAALVDAKPTAFTDLGGQHAVILIPIHPIIPSSHHTEAGRNLLMRVPLILRACEEWLLMRVPLILRACEEWFVT